MGLQNIKMTCKNCEVEEKEFEENCAHFPPVWPLKKIENYHSQDQKISIINITYKTCSDITTEGSHLKR